PVTDAHISSVKMVPDIENNRLTLKVIGSDAASGMTVHAVAKDGSQVVGQQTGSVGQTLQLAVPNAKLWSPKSPFLYQLTVKLEKNGKAIYQVQSYFGMRSISVQKDKKGINRLFLNGKPVF